MALASGAEGIGLYRSEFLLVGGSPDLAGEDEQYDVYRHVVQNMTPRPVTIRTFDIDERQRARPLVDTALDARWFAGVHGRYNLPLASRSEPDWSTAFEDKSEVRSRGHTKHRRNGY